MYQKCDNPYKKDEVVRGKITSTDIKSRDGTVYYICKAINENGDSLNDGNGSITFCLKYWKSDENPIIGDTVLMSKIKLLRNPATQKTYLRAYLIKKA